MTEPVRYAQRQYAVPDDATEIVFVRHGASAEAVEGEQHELLDGRGNPPLSETGREQAERVGERLASESLAAIFVSSLRRTHETARPLVERVGIEPVELPDLAEVSLGDLEGGEFRIRAHRRDPIVMRALTEQRWDVIPNAEPMEEFAVRVRRAVNAIVAQTGAGVSVAAFAHGGVIGELAHQATQSRRFAFMRNDNASITRLVVHADGSLYMRCFNDTAHLT